MRFELMKNCGNHREGKTTYVAGDVIESESDLAARFKNKFRKMDPNLGLPSVDELAATGHENPEELLAKLKAARAKKKGKKKDSKKLTRKSKDPRGVDATKNFTGVADEGLKVFRNGAAFSIYDGDEKKVLNEKSLKKSEVIDFVKEYLEG